MLSVEEVKNRCETLMINKTRSKEITDRVMKEVVELHERFVPQFKSGLGRRTNSGAIFAACFWTTCVQQRIYLTQLTVSRAVGFTGNTIRRISKKIMEEF